MTLDLMLDSPQWLLGQLVASALKGGVLAAIAAFGLAVSKSAATTTRLLAWKIVLCGALATPFLSLLLPPLQIPLPAVISPTMQTTGKSLPSGTRIYYADGLQRQAEASPIKSEKFAPVGATSYSHTLELLVGRIPWPAVVVVVYCLIAVILLLRFAMGAALSQRLVRSAKKIDEPGLGQKIARMQSGTRVADSELIVVPLTVGMLRPTVLLPANWREWNDATLESVLAHEISHVARRDSLTQSIALLYRALFWFSPLSWWLERHITNLAEQCSDEAALSCGVDSRSYAQTLLKFLHTLQRAPGRVRWQGVSMANAGSAERRIERILACKGAVTMRLKKSAVVAAVALAIPVIYVTASARPRSMQEPTAPTTAPVAVQAAPRILPSPPAAPVIAGVPTPAVNPPGPAVAFAPTTPFAPVSSFARSQNGGSAPSSYSYAYGDDDEDRYVIVSGKTDSMTMSGSSQDMRHVDKLKKQISGDFIWFQRDEKSYIIRDQATVDRARKFWFEQAELGKKQAELGAQQEALGKQQEELGSHMEKIQVKVPDMTADLDKLKAELQALSSKGATADQVGRIQSEIGELQSKIGEVQSSAGEQQSKIGEQMSELGEKQSKLGEEQGKLGERQEAIAREASQKMKALLDEALKNGTAQPEPQNASGGTI